MAAVLSLLVLLAVALVLGAFVLWRRGGSRRQVVLMLILAAIAAANVAIWTVPDAKGDRPLEHNPEHF
ncbi:MAG TPA: hypothetical protein VJM34_06535 [Novosphingobium sp.]|nr:hypothetical protein [Novosphingobium sp.]